MQTLGISDTTPQAEDFLKRLFWPSIRSGSDVDTLGSRGYWVCAILAAIGLLTTIATGHPIAGFFSPRHRGFQNGTLRLRDWQERPSRFFRLAIAPLRAKGRRARGRRICPGARR